MELKPNSVGVRITFQKQSRNAPALDPLVLDHFAEKLLVANVPVVCALGKGVELTIVTQIIFILSSCFLGAEWT